MKETKVNGRLILKEVSIDTIYCRKVGNNNPTSGKVSLPKKLIGRDVFVILNGDEK